MAKPTIYPSDHLDPSSPVWESLKAAIANSSGFKRWQQDVTIDQQQLDMNLDHQVRRYLRETLATLAY